MATTAGDPEHDIPMEDRIMYLNIYLGIMAAFAIGSMLLMLVFPWKENMKDTDEENVLRESIQEDGSSNDRKKLID